MDFSESNGNLYDQEINTPTAIESDSEGLERISKLVQDASSMQRIAEEKTRATEQYFNTLRERLHNSTTFLNSIKRDIENIKFSFQKDQLHDFNNADFLEYNDKTDEELDLEMDKIKERLQDLQSRVQTVQTNIKENDNFETAMTKTVKLLDDVSKGIYEEEEEDKK